MRRFFSYGPVDKDLHYHAPRTELIEQAHQLLLGDEPTKNGHYITIWAPWQRGKTWLLGQILNLLKKDDRFDAIKINLDYLKEEDVKEVISLIAEEIGEELNKDFSGIQTKSQFQKIFKKGILEKPLVLILDHFDALEQPSIRALAGVFRNIYIKRMEQNDKTSEEKSYLLHSIALIRVRSVLGIEYGKSSLYNIQRNLRIPNLSKEEVTGMFQSYVEESGQEILPEVVEKIYGETLGHPGLTSWFGELLTEKYNEDKTSPISMKNFVKVLEKAINVLPNDYILNIINKVKQESHNKLLQKMFKTDEVFPFRYDDPDTNFLYINDIIEPVESGHKNVIRFTNPFLKKRLSNYFSSGSFNEDWTMSPPKKPRDNYVTTIYCDDIPCAFESEAQEENFLKQLFRPIVRIVIERDGKSNEIKSLTPAEKLLLCYLAYKNYKALQIENIPCWEDIPNNYQYRVSMKLENNIKQVPEWIIFQDALAREDYKYIGDSIRMWVYSIRNKLKMINANELIHSPAGRGSGYLLKGIVKFSKMRTNRKNEG